MWDYLSSFQVCFETSKKYEPSVQIRTIPQYSLGAPYTSDMFMLIHPYDPPNIYWGLNEKLYGVN